MDEITGGGSHVSTHPVRLLRPVRACHARGTGLPAGTLAVGLAPW